MRRAEVTAYHWTSWTSELISGRTITSLICRTSFDSLYLELNLSNLRTENGMKGNRSWVRVIFSYVRNIGYKFSSGKYNRGGGRRLGQGGRRREECVRELVQVPVFPSFGEENFWKIAATNYQLLWTTPENFKVLLEKLNFWENFEIFLTYPNLMEANRASISGSRRGNILKKFMEGLVAYLYKP